MCDINEIKKENKGKELICQVIGCTEKVDLRLVQCNKHLKEVLCKEILDMIEAKE